MQRTRLFYFAILILFSFSGCQKSKPVDDTTPSPTPVIIVSDTEDNSGSPDKGLISILMTKHSNYSVKTSEEIKKKLEGEGYVVDLKAYEDYFSEYYIEQLAAKGCKVIVTTCSLESGYSLMKLKEAGITVIGFNYRYDNIDYYVSFDMFRAAGLQAEYIVDALGIKDGKGPFNIEFFQGACLMETYTHFIEMQ